MSPVAWSRKCLPDWYFLVRESGLQPIENSPQLPYNWGNRDNWIDFQAYLPLGVAPVR